MVAVCFMAIETEVAVIAGQVPVVEVEVAMVAGEIEAVAANICPVVPDVTAVMVERSLGLGSNTGEEQTGGQ
jgi:hypothetical protein